jgi:hypothetical protein
MQHNPNTLIDLLCCDAHGYQVQSRQPHADVHCLPIGAAAGDMGGHKLR